MIAFGNAGRPITDGVKCAIMHPSTATGATILCYRRMERVFELLLSEGATLPFGRRRLL